MTAINDKNSNIYSLDDFDDFTISRATSTGFDLQQGLELNLNFINPLKHLRRFET